MKNLKFEFESEPDSYLNMNIIGNEKLKNLGPDLEPDPEPET